MIHTAEWRERESAELTVRVRKRGGHQQWKYNMSMRLHETFSLWFHHQIKQQGPSFFLSTSLHRNYTALYALYALTFSGLVKLIDSRHQSIDLINILINSESSFFLLWNRLSGRKKKTKLEKENGREVTKRTNDGGWRRRRGDAITLRDLEGDFVFPMILLSVWGPLELSSRVPCVCVCALLKAIA
jgi:hypothetical protein